MKEEIQKKVDEAYEEIEKVVKKSNSSNEKEAKKENEAPCSVCGKSKFVLKYRDVNGTVKGSISGYFSLFGGSISGDIDGETHTDPILSCRECGNERKIVIPHHVSTMNIYELQIPYMPTYIPLEPDQRKVSEWLQGFGLEVACELQRQKFSWAEDYNKFYTYSTDTTPRFTEKEFGYLGLKRKYEIGGYVKPEETIGSIAPFVIGVIIFLFICFFIAFIASR